MEAVACDHCGRAQPLDWRPDDACIHCGHAARRQARCPWCTRLVPGTFCRHCGCALVDAADYGVARMLFAAGVDRLSLVERLARLDPAQREVLASRFAAQRACVAMRIEEARACEAHLATRGWAAALEEELVRWLPVPDDTAWLVPGADPDPARVFATTALDPLRQLAALACVRLGIASRDALELCRWLAESDQPLAVEAALAISGWRARRARWLDLRRGRGRTARLAEALARPELAAEAAVGLALDQLDMPDALAPLLPHVRDALATAGREDVRFGAALVLADDAHLADALARSDADEDTREAALAALARAQSQLVIAQLAGGDAATRLFVLRRLTPPLSGAILAAVLDRIADGDAAVRAQAIGLVQRARFGELAPDARARIAGWVAAHDGALAIPELARFLDWARRDGAQLDPAELRPLVDALTRALAAAPELDPAWAEHDALGPWLLGVMTERDRAVLDRLLAAPATSRAIWSTLLLLHARASEDGPAADSAPLGLVLDAWQRAGAARAAWLPALAREIGDHRGYRGIDALIEALWRRFLAHAGERADVVVALAACKQELYERRDAQPAALAPDGGDPVRFFELWSAAAPGDLRAIFEAALARGGGEASPALLDAALACARAALATRPAVAVLFLARIAQVVCNAFLAGSTEASCAAVAALRETWAAVEPALAQLPAAWHGDHGYLLGHVRDELDIIARREAELAERERAQAAREREHAARQAEQARRAADAEAARQAEQARRDAIAADAAERRATARALLVRDRDALAPDLAPSPLDDEPLGPPPVPTLRAYTRLMKQLSGGADALLLFDVYGLDAASWAACVQAWQRALAARPDAMLRFAALLQAAWSAR